MQERMIWKNGKIVPESEAYFSIYDEAMMFGTCIFEMMRTFKRRTFKLHEHIQRLMTSLKILEIDIPYSWRHLYNEHENLLLHNRKCFKDDDEIRSLINVSRGILPIYRNMLNDSGQPNVIIACFPLKEIIRGMSKFYKTGVSAIVPSQRAIPQDLLDPKIKSRSRQHYQMANLEVKRQDEDAWALLLDDKGYLTEFTGSNVFLRKQSSFELFTPKGTNCLRGISRQYVMEIARKHLQIEVIEKDLTLYDAYEATEIFATCTPYSIMPVTKINNKFVGDGQVGKVTKRLISKWSEMVNCDFVQQAIDWDKEWQT